MILILQRHEAEGDAVYGDMRILSSDGTVLDEMTTLENRKYMIAESEEELPQPSGTHPAPQGATPALPTKEGERGYGVVLTWSPRFKRVLPLVCGVAGRSGIRFHQGSRPEHSRGCILLSAGNLNRLIVLLEGAKEEVRLVTRPTPALKDSPQPSRTHPYPPYKGGGGPTPALPTEGGGGEMRLAGMVVGMVLTGIVLTGMVFTGCRGVQPGISIERSMRNAIDSSRNSRYERVEVHDTVVVAVGGMGVAGGPGSPGRAGRPSSLGSPGRAGGLGGPSRAGGLGGPSRAGSPGGPGRAGSPGGPGRAGSPGGPGRAGGPGGPGRAGSPGGPGRAGSPGDLGGMGGMEVVYRSHYEIRKERDTVYRNHVDTMYRNRVDTVYQTRRESIKERYVPPFYRWCAGILIGMILLGAVWIGLRLRSR